MQSGLDFPQIPKVAARVLTSPASFFREMPRKGGYVEPLVFAVVMGVVGGIIQAVFSLLKLNLAAEGMGLMAIIMIPVMVAIFSFAAAAILFIIWKLMGSAEDYETAYRCAAYISALAPINSLLGIIPYAGTIVGIALATFFLVTASVEVHRLESGKAWLVFGIIGLVLIFGTMGMEYAGRKAVKDLPKFQQDMQDAARKAQEQAQQPGQQPPPDAAQAQAQGRAQLDAAIAQMEQQMAGQPPEVQEQMRKAVEQMKQARDQQH